MDVFITYEGKRAPDVCVQRYATRKVIAGEVPSYIYYIWQSIDSCATKIDAQLATRHADVIERGRAKTHDIFKKYEFLIWLLLFMANFDVFFFELN